MGGGAHVGCSLSHTPMHAWRRSCPKRCILYSIWWWITECAEITISIWCRQIPQCAVNTEILPRNGQNAPGETIWSNFAINWYGLRVRHHGGELRSAACFPTFPCMHGCFPTFPCMHGAGHVQNVALFTAFGDGSQKVG